MSNIWESGFWKDFKYIIVLIVILLSIIVCFSFALKFSHDDRRELENIIASEINSLVIYTDKETGVQYVRPAFREGITPRLFLDGTLYVEND